MSARVCVGESYTAMSHGGEIAAVSSIVPIYRTIFIISPRTCGELPRIDWEEETGAGAYRVWPGGTERKPEYWLERRKQS